MASQDEGTGVAGEEGGAEGVGAGSGGTNTTNVNTITPSPASAAAETETASLVPLLVVPTRKKSTAKKKPRVRPNMSKQKKGVGGG
eukprot:CAMPEP_0203679574 /NCGR_PEP_ID=MMETSP0090-20130426/36244_1 /ASSEMBLY_ACC=CAM_ASM_001088 /TAXON_ID=426623 /ORGANISM="Chaetoceros affinis, Strain CCMP159" /LENGTH=85 /DNA_ID=CAMNT_0050547275 /DNA_START=123 /DNA_END=377 /DNA_ORIENTATION=+